MTPGLCPICGDEPQWCPKQNGGKPPAVPESSEDRRMRVEADIAARKCAYCDSLGGIVQSANHSSYCPRYVKQKRGAR